MANARPVLGRPAAAATGLAAAVALSGVLSGVLSGCTGDREESSVGGAQRSLASATGAPQVAGKGPDRPAGLVHPRNAGQAARVLTWAERAISHPSTPDSELRRAARQQQLAYRALGGHPGWDSAVLSAVPRSLRVTVRNNVAARREFRAMHAVLSDTLPAWRIVAPAPAAQLLRDYERGERAYGIGWEYLAAINLVETGMGRIRGTSTAGAQGPMQFLPSTWARWGRGDVNDPADAIMAAARYLAHDGGARAGGMDDALYRYNNSRHYVRGVTLLAQVMERRPRAFYGYYHWDVYYLTSRGDVRLPVGYDQDRLLPVQRWLATHPQR
jgi:hypothetical protein